MPRTVLDNQRNQRSMVCFLLTWMTFYTGQIKMLSPTHFCPRLLVAIPLSPDLFLISKIPICTQEDRQEAAPLCFQVRSDHPPCFSFPHILILKIPIWVFLTPIILKAPQGQGPNAVFDMKARQGATASRRLLMLPLWTLTLLHGAARWPPNTNILHHLPD